MKLELGVVDVAYHDRKGTATTGDVAEFLEGNYHVMRVFAEEHRQDIATDLADLFSRAMTRITAGEPARITYGQHLSPVKRQFMRYLDAGEWGDVSKQTVMAALNGVSHRRKRPNKKRPGRTAFVDTGQYENAFYAKLTRG